MNATAARKKTRPGDTPEGRELAEVMKDTKDANKRLRRFLEKHTDKCRCPACVFDVEMIRTLRALAVTNKVILEDVESRRCGPMNTSEEAQQMHEEYLTSKGLPAIL